MGLNIVHPEGKVLISMLLAPTRSKLITSKPAKTIFNLIRYDINTDSSVVRCEFAVMTPTE